MNLEIEYPILKQHFQGDSGSAVVGWRDDSEQAIQFGVIHGGFNDRGVLADVRCVLCVEFATRVGVSPLYILCHRQTGLESEQDEETSRSFFTGNTCNGSAS